MPNTHTGSRRSSLSFLALGCALIVGGVAACDSDSSPTPSGDNAVLVGSVESSSSGAAAFGAASGAQQATWVTAGTLRSDGSLDVLAEAEVASDGSFRIEGLPGGSGGLVVRAESDGGSEVGRVFVHQKTEAETETRIAPIDASTTLHARAVGSLHGSNPDPASSAELALHLMISGDAAAATSSAEVSALANGAASAAAAETAVHAEWGTGIDTDTRSTILLDAMAQFEQSMYAGASLEAAHRSYREAVVDGMIDAGLDARAAAAAQASAVTTADLQWSGSGAASAHVEALKNAMRLNVHTRARLAGDVESDPVELRGATLQALGELEADIEAATSVQALRQASANYRAEVEADVRSAVLGALDGLSLDLLATIEAELEGVVATARLWTALESSATAEARAEATATWSAEVEAAVDAWIDTLPDDEAAEVDADAVTRLFLAMGAGASFS